MGELVWHEYARFTALTASICVSSSPLTTIAGLYIHLDAVWAGFWGLFYRKFFWDFIGGILRNPGGLQSAIYPLVRDLFLTST